MKTRKFKSLEHELVVCLLHSGEDAVFEVLEDICDFKDKYVHDPRLHSEDRMERLLALALEELRIWKARSDKAAIKKQKATSKTSTHKRKAIKPPE